MMIKEECPLCFGEGQIFDGHSMQECTRCQGEGLIEVQEEEEDFLDDFPEDFE